MDSSPSLPTALPEESALKPGRTSHAAIHEGLTVELTPAPLLKRLFAICVDWGILGASSYLFFIVGGFLMVAVTALLANLFSNQLSGFFSDPFLATLIMLLVIAVLLLGYLCLIHGYFIYFHLKRGATPGKRLFGLKVISLDGKALSRGQCILRESLVYLDLGFIFPGLISILATQRSQRLGDLAAGTMVIHSALTEERDQYLYITQEEYHMLKDVLTLQPLSSHLAEEYLKFAYPYFITKGHVPSTYELERWETRARRFITNAEDHGLDQQSVLLFLAEHCFQAARS